MAHRERRHAPSPLNLSTSRPSSTLLYDLPSDFPSIESSTPSAFSTAKSPRSPPRTPRNRPGGILSPTSSAFNPPASGRNSVLGLHQPQPSYASSTGYGGPTPNRSASGTPIHEMESFAVLCRTWYFQQDANAGAQVQEILRSLPASQRAAYTRLQSQIRSSYHTAVALRRDSEFNAHMSSTRPGQSLTPLNRQYPMSKSAREERFERVQKFVNVWATSGNIGTRPFFDGLFAVLRLQALPEKLGGAGAKRMEWEVDDAVFKESAGKEFMLESIDILKGVLGFEESLSSIQQDALSSSTTTAIDPPPLYPPQESPISSPRKAVPPPLPPRSAPPQLNENRKSRPPLPTIASASVLDQQRESASRTATGDGRRIRPFSTTYEDDAPIEQAVDFGDESDTFADPVSPRSQSRRPSSPSARPAVPPRKRRLGSHSNGGGEEIMNRNRSHSDPFDDTHGHLTYGHGRTRTQGSIGTLSGLNPGPSPLLAPLLASGGAVGGGSSVGTTTTDSSLSKVDGKIVDGIGGGSNPKQSVPLPLEDSELDVARPMALNPPTPGEPGDSDDEYADNYMDQEVDSKRGGAFGLSFVGKGRRSSETTSLGLLGSTNGTTQKALTFDKQKPKPPPVPTHRVMRTGSEGGANRATGPKSPQLPPRSSISRPGTPDAGLALTSSNFVNTAGIIGAEQHMRTWVVPPYLTNPEIMKLLDLFPTTISRGSVPRFKSAAAMGKKERRAADPDLEAGENEPGMADQKEYVRHGTGRMWIGDKERNEGWKGGLWDRFIGWWRRVFC